jgi:hypothetical protein
MFREQIFLFAVKQICGRNANKHKRIVQNRDAAKNKENM